MGDEVILNWKRHDKFKEEESKKDTGADSSKKKIASSRRTRSLVIKSAKKRVYGSFSPNGKLSYTNKLCGSPYINLRCKRAHGVLLKDFMGSTYRDAGGNVRRYGLSDLKYDTSAGRLVVRAR